MGRVDLGSADECKQQVFVSPVVGSYSLCNSNEHVEKMNDSGLCNSTMNTDCYTLSTGTQTINVESMCSNTAMQTIDPEKQNSECQIDIKATKKTQTFSTVSTHCKPVQTHYLKHADIQTLPTKLENASTSIELLDSTNKACATDPPVSRYSQTHVPSQKSVKVTASTFRSQSTQTEKKKKCKQDTPSYKEAQSEPHEPIKHQGIQVLQINFGVKAFQSLLAV